MLFYHVGKGEALAAASQNIHSPTTPCRDCPRPALLAPHLCAAQTWPPEMDVASPGRSPHGNLLCLVGRNHLYRIVRQAPLPSAKPQQAGSLSRTSAGDPEGDNKTSRRLENKISCSFMGSFSFIISDTSLGGDAQTKGSHTGFTGTVKLCYFWFFQRSGLL